MEEKPPWFKMNPSQFLQDSLIDSLSTLELGIVFRLLCRQWIDGSIPADTDMLSRMCRVPKETIEMSWSIISQIFPEIETGKRANRFMWHERELVMVAHQKRSDAGRDAIRRRWDVIREEKVSNRSPIADLLQGPIADLIQDTDTDKDKDIKIVASHDPPLNGQLFLPEQELVLSPPEKKPKKPTNGKLPDSLEAILGGRDSPLWSEFWELSPIWPEGSNIKKKESARAYAEARKVASAECIYRWAEWTLKDTDRKITTLSAWLSNQDWVGRQETHENRSKRQEVAT